MELLRREDGQDRVRGRRGLYSSHSVIDRGRLRVEVARSGTSSKGVDAASVPWSVFNQLSTKVVVSGAGDIMERRSSLRL